MKSNGYPTASRFLGNNVDAVLTPPDQHCIVHNSQLLQITTFRTEVVGSGLDCLNKEMALFKGISLTRATSCPQPCAPKSHEHVFSEHRAPSLTSREGFGFKALWGFGFRVRRRSPSPGH
eukprot:2147398-Amphidinium_carterae.1